MSDTLSPTRTEPVILRASPADRPGERVIEVAPSQPAATQVAPPPTDPDVAAGPASGLDQLSRIEDKTARIEEKYARSEARMQRVVDKVDTAMDRMGNVALQSDLAAVRGEVGIISRRIKRLPGFGAMLLTAAVTAVLTAGIIIALLRFYPALLAR